jgi:hypothetical protein
MGQSRDKERGKGRRGKVRERRRAGGERTGKDDSGGTETGSVRCTGGGLELRRDGHLSNESSSAEERKEASVACWWIRDQLAFEISTSLDNHQPP